MSVNRATKPTFLFGLMTLLFATSPLVSQAQDRFDYNQYAETIERLGVPNGERIRELRVAALALYESGRYSEAIDALDTWAQTADFYVKIVSQGVPPADVAPLGGASLNEMRQFTSAIQAANKEMQKFIDERDLAMVMLAECKFYLGKTEEALSAFLNVLATMETKDKSTWTRASTGLYSIVGFVSPAF